MFIINDADVVVVDTGGYRTDARQIIAEIKKLTDKPVRYVINTHSHGDHISGDEIYRDAFPAVEFICHTNAAVQILQNPSAEKSVALFQAEIANVLMLHRGERSIEIRYLGNGHTTGDLIVFLPKEKIVATADLVVAPIPFGFSTTLHDWPATLQALKKLNAVTILPGHGEIESDWTYVDRQIALFEST